MGKGRMTVALMTGLLVVQGCAGGEAGDKAGGSGGETAPPAGTNAAPTTTATGPAGDSDAGVDKAGNAVGSDTVTLTVSTFSSPERPRGALAARFADAVAEAGGPLAVDVEYSAADPLADFMSGAVDMVLTPTNALDGLGVTTFRALSLPFLVDDDEQADRVAADPVVATLLSGLSAIDATGLLFAPVAEQHLALQGGEPLRALDQIAGGVRAVPESEVAKGLYDALGSTAVYGLNNDAWDAAVIDGDVVAKEFPTALWGVGPLPSVMASNLAITYDFEVLLIRNDVLSQLPPQAAESLRAAAASAQQRQIDERVREEEAFRNECAKGAALSAAPVTLWAEIGRAADDFVLTQLDDPATRDIYDAVKRAAGQRTVAWPNECINGQVVPYEPATTAGTGPEPGTYRVDGRTVEQLLVSGVGADSATQGNVVDHWDLTLADGRATLAFHMPDGSVREQHSSYAVDGDGYLAFTADPGSDGLNGSLAWSPTSDGFLTEPLPTDDVEGLNVMYDVAGLGLFGEFTRVG